jgi:hypothetical protein
MVHLLTLSIAIALLTPAVGARDAEMDRRAVVALESEWLRAEHDRGVLERVLADDFVHPVAQGVFLTKRQHIDWAILHPEATGRKLAFEKLDVRVYGYAAIATGIVDDSDSHGHDIHRTVFTDVFVHRAGRWQAVNAQENVMPGGQ